MAELFDILERLRFIATFLSLSVAPPAEFVEAGRRFH